MCEQCTGTNNCKHKVFRGNDGELYSGLEISAMVSEAWSNNSCKGYIIKAMENKDFKRADIEKIIGELKYVFDEMTLQQADNYYCKW